MKIFQKFLKTRAIKIIKKSGKEFRKLIPIDNSQKG